MIESASLDTVVKLIIKKDLSTSTIVSSVTVTTTTTLSLSLSLINQSIVSNNKNNIKKETQTTFTTGKEKTFEFKGRSICKLPQHREGKVNKRKDGLAACT